MKKAFSFFLILILALTTVSFNVFAADADTDTGEEVLYPAIDTQLNEGKTKIRIQTTDTIYGNFSAGMLYSSSGGRTLSYTVNCETAGKYYLTVYVAEKYSDGSFTGTLKVNDGESTEVTYLTSNGLGKNNTDAAVNKRGSRPNTFEVDLVAGENTLSLTYSGSNYGIGFVELTNYDRADIGTDWSISEKGFEVEAEVQPTDTHIAVYKVYDSIIEAVTAGHKKGSMIVQVSNPTSDVKKNIELIAEKYNDGVLQESEVLSIPIFCKTTQTTFDLGEFTFGEANEYRFYVSTGGSSPQPLTETVTETVPSYVPEDGADIVINESLSDGISLDLYFEKEGYYYITTTGCGNGDSNAKISANGENAVENILKSNETGEFTIGVPFEMEEGMNELSISLMDASNSDAELSKISIKPNTAPVFGKTDISTVRPLVGETVSLEVLATDVEGELAKYSYKVIPEGADEEEIDEQEMTLENGDYTAEITFSSIGKYGVKLIAYDACGAACEKTLNVNCVDVKTEDALITKETVSDGIKLTGELDLYISSDSGKCVTLILAVYDENNMMISHKNTALTAVAGVNPISVETLFQPPESGTWSAELMLWDTLIHLNSLTDVTVYN